MRGIELDAGLRVNAKLPPPRAGEGEAELALVRAGICDTDLQLARGYMGYRGVIGHEFVARVEKASTPELEGRRVVGDINAGCGRCADCRTADGHHCIERTVLGILGRGGCFAERFCLPERNLVALPDGLEDDVAVFAEPLAAALHVLDEVKGQGRQRAVVLGDGKLGLLTGLALAAAGHEVTQIGHHDHKLGIARAGGCRGLLEAELLADGVSPTYDLVVEATGSAHGLARAFSLCRPRGCVILKTTVADEWQIDLSPVVIHEFRLVGSRCGDMQAAVDMLASGRIDPTPLIEAEYALADGERAMAHAARKGAMKILLRP